MLPNRSFDPFFDYPNRIYNQNFGMGISEADFPNFSPFWGLRHQRRIGTLQRETGTSELKCTRNQFQVKLDVRQFSPEELSVKAVDNYIVVEGKHEEKQDEHGFISRSFSRRYQLPDDIDPETFDEKVICNLSSDGLLSISIPKNPPTDKNESKTKIIPIVQEGASKNTEST